MRRSTFIVFSLFIIMSLVLGACAPAAATEETGQSSPTQVPVTGATATPQAAAESTAPAAQEGRLPEVDPGAVTGNIITAGSSTVYPLTEAIVQLFEEEGYAGQVTVDSVGTGGGFERFCKTGETDIANASRPIKDSEKENCAAIGRAPVEFRVGTDALAVVVNPQNDFLTDVTLEQLAMIFTNQAEKWSDVDPSWPAEPIKRYTPGTDSGTYD